MDILFDEVESRILGVLIEKQMATPDYYPMTLNALVNGCNQKTNREPVMSLEPETVEQALEGLRKQRMVWQVKAQGSRSLKYEHNMNKAAEFSDRELGIVCVLLLRGPQTVGELRSRTGRLVEFHGLAAVEHTLQKLINHEKGPFILRLERQPGHKENRYAHLFCEVALQSESGIHLQAENLNLQESDAEKVRNHDLQRQVADLKREMEDLKSQFQEFKSQFE